MWLYLLPYIFASTWHDIRSAVLLMICIQTDTIIAAPPPIIGSLPCSCPWWSMRTRVKTILKWFLYISSRTTSRWAKTSLPLRPSTNLRAFRFQNHLLSFQGGVSHRSCVRFDSEGRCAAMLMYGSHLAVISFKHTPILDDPTPGTPLTPG